MKNDLPLNEETKPNQTKPIIYIYICLCVYIYIYIQRERGGQGEREKYRQVGMTEL